MSVCASGYVFYIKTYPAAFASFTRVPEIHFFFRFWSVPAAVPHGTDIVLAIVFHLRFQILLKEHGCNPYKASYYYILYSTVGLCGSVSGIAFQFGLWLGIGQET